MNKRMTMLLIAAVVTILPAVAVADVLITGYATLEGSQHGAVFDLEAGSNYYAANAAGAITWMSNSQGPAMGTLDLEGISNQSTSMINVLDLNMSQSSAPGMLNLSVSDTVGLSSLPVGAIMYISTAPFDSYFGSSTGTVQSIDLNAGGYAVFSVSPGGTLYFAFYLPAGTYLNTGVTLTGVYTAS